jgi:8-oxo-dGTP diphosphatase
MEINRPKIGVGVLIKHDNKILLLKRKNAHGCGTWAPPGGHLELGESVLDCAQREALEEANVTIKNARILTITEDIFDAQKHYITIWVVSDYDAGIVTNNEPEKCEALEWRALNNLPENLFLSFSNLLKQKNNGHEDITF